MPDVNSFADKTRDWRGLLDACEANPDLFPNTDPFRVTLAEALEKVTVLKAQQSQWEGLRQSATQQINTLIEQGSEAARRLRRYVTAHLGTKNEQLSQFGVQPLRRRVRRPAARRPVPEPPAPPVVPEPEKPAA